MHSLLHSPDVVLALVSELDLLAVVDAHATGGTLVAGLGDHCLLLATWHVERLADRIGSRLGLLEGGSYRDLGASFLRNDGQAGLVAELGAHTETVAGGRRLSDLGHVRRTGGSVATVSDVGGLEEPDVVGRWGSPAICRSLEGALVAAGRREETKKEWMSPLPQEERREERRCATSTHALPTGPPGQSSRSC